MASSWEDKQSSSNLTSFQTHVTPNTLQLWLYLGRFYQVQLFNYCFFWLSDCCLDALKEIVCTFTWCQSSRSTKFYQSKTLSKTQHDFRVRFTEIPSWGSPSTYGDVVSPAATEVGARQLARRGERLSQTPCLKGGRRRGKRERMLNRCASTKYVN